jgi:hypothetical protein
VESRKRIKNVAAGIKLPILVLSYLNYMI